MKYYQEEAEHYRRIRTDPIYRLQERMAYLELLQEPAWYCPEEEETIVPPVPSEHRLFNKMQQLEGRLIFTENKINSYLDKKRKSDTYKKGIEHGNKPF